MIPKNLWTYVVVNTMVLCILGSHHHHEKWTVEVHLNDLKGYDHCLVYADKGEAASLCSSIESECIEEIMMEGSGKPVTTLPDHIRNNYSPLNSNSGPTMYKGELSIPTHPGNTSMAVSCTKASNESTWQPEMAWEIRRDIKVPYCFIRTKQSLQSEKFQESMKLTFSQNCAGSCSEIDDCCNVQHDGIYYRSKEECAPLTTNPAGDNTFVTVVAVLTTLIIMLLLVTVICAVAVLKTARGNTCTKRYKPPKTPTSPTAATTCKFDQSTSDTVAIKETQVKIED